MGFWPPIRLAAHGVGQARPRRPPPLGLRSLLKTCSTTTRRACGVGLTDRQLRLTRHEHSFARPATSSPPSTTPRSSVRSPNSAWSESVEADGPADRPADRVGLSDEGHHRPRRSGVPFGAVRVSPAWSSPWGSMTDEQRAQLPHHPAWRQAAKEIPFAQPGSLDQGLRASRRQGRVGDGLNLRAGRPPRAARSASSTPTSTATRSPPCGASPAPLRPGRGHDHAGAHVAVARRLHRHVLSSAATRSWPGPAPC